MFLHNSKHADEPYGMHMVLYAEALVMFVSTCLYITMAMPYDQTPIHIWKKIRIHTDIYQDLEQFKPMWYSTAIVIAVVDIIGVFSIYKIYVAFRDVNPSLMMMYMVWKPVTMLLMLIGTICHHVAEENRAYETNDLRGTNPERERKVIQTVFVVIPTILLVVCLALYITAYRSFLYLKHHQNVKSSGVEEKIEPKV